MRHSRRLCAAVASRWPIIRCITGGHLAASGNRVAASGLPEIGIHMRLSHRAAIECGETMTTAYSSTVLNHPLETVWDLIRDFNNYPSYIEGVSESVIEDDKGGDEVGAVRRFCYLGSSVRQRLAAHSDAAHSLTYAG